LVTYALHERLNKKRNYGNSTDAEHATVLIFYIHVQHRSEQDADIVLQDAT
jgi:hypothetical protein